MHTEEPPKEIKITFQEEDRQKADYYTNGKGCLVATALKRMGYERPLCNVFSHEVDGHVYVCEHTHGTALHHIPNSASGPGPYYGEGVVGKQVTLILND